jgi:hypothetical protein
MIDSCTTMVAELRCRLTDTRSMFQCPPNYPFPLCQIWPNSVHDDETPVSALGYLLSICASKPARKHTHSLFLAVLLSLGQCLSFSTRSLENHIHDVFSPSIPSSRAAPPPPHHSLTRSTLTTPLRHLPSPLGNPPHLHQMALRLLRRRPRKPLQRHNRERPILERRIHLPGLSYTLHSESGAAIRHHSWDGERLEGDRGYQV